MKVSELVTQLQSLNQDAEVLVFAQDNGYTSLVEVEQFEAFQSFCAWTYERRSSLWSHNEDEFKFIDAVLISR